MKKCFLILLCIILFHEIKGQVAPIVGYRYWFDNDINNGATVTLATTQDINVFNLIKAKNPLQNGFHSVSFMAQQSNKKWSIPVTSNFYYATNGSVTIYEYWFDKAFSNKQTVQIVDTNNLVLTNQMLNTASLTNGFHQFNIRFKINGGSWSSVQSSNIFKRGNDANALLDVKKIRYWFDSSFLNLKEIITTGQEGIISNLIDCSNLTIGKHAINYQTMDNGNIWSSMLIDSFTVSCLPPAAPTISSKNNTTLCQGLNDTLVSSVNNGNQWYLNDTAIDGATGKSYVATKAGNYTVTDSANGCVSVASSAVAIKSTPVNPAITSKNTTTFCQGGSDTLLSNSPSGNQWYKDGVLLSGETNQTYTATNNGIYTVSVSVGNGCVVSGTSAGVTVTVNTNPTVSAINISIGNPGGNICIGPTVAVLSNATSGGIWSSSDISKATINTSPVVTLTALAAGTLTVTYTVTDNKGCVGVASKSVTIFSPPSVSSITGLNTVVVGSTIPLTSSTGGGIWSSCDNTKATVDNNGIVTGIASGSATISYLVTNANGCSSSVSSNITITTPAVITSSCPAVSITNTGSTCNAMFSINGASIAENISWYSGTTLVNTVTKVLATTGTSVAGGNGQGSGAKQLDNPAGIFVDVNGNVYVADQYNHRVQKWAPGATTGITVAGGNGTGTAANQLYDPTGIFVDVSGNIYIADGAGNRIQKWAPGASSGITVAGGNSFLQSAGPNQLNGPTGVYVDGNGNIYIADQGNNRIQKWAVGANTGTTVAGGNGNGSAANQLANPSGVWVDASGNIFIADKTNHRIQKWASGANVGTTVAGGNNLGSAANQLYFPSGVSVDCNGNIYIADATNNRIQKWIDGASSGQTVAGGNVGLGPSSGANQLNGPSSIFLDGNGAMYIADQYNHRVQKWTPSIVSTYTPATSGTYTAVANFGGNNNTTSNAITVSVSAGPPIITAGSATTFCTGSNVVLTSNSPSGNQWYKDGQIITGETNQTYTASTSGIYTTNVSITTGCVNSGTSSGTVVTVNPLPTNGVITGSLSVCVGSTTTLSNTTPAGIWSSSNNSVASVNNAGVVSGINAGSVTITYTVTNNITGCSSTQSKTIIVNAIPTISPITGNTNICVGTTGVLSNTTSGGIWSISNTNFATINNNGIVTGIAAGTSTINYSITNSSGCVATASLSITINSSQSQPTISALGPTTFCTGGSVILSSSSTSGNQWFKDGVLIPGETNQNYTANSSGTYTVNITVSYGCISSGSSNSLSVAVNSLPAITTISGNSTICVSATSTLTNGASGGTWSSSNANIVSVNSNNGLTTGISVGTAIIKYEITNTSGCVATSYLTVTVNMSQSQPTITAGSNTTFCSGSNVVLTSSSATSNQWYRDGSLLNGETNQNYTASISGTYTVGITVSNGCVASGTSLGKTVTVNAQPTLIIQTPTAVCSPSTIDLTAASITSGSTAGLLFTQWNNQAATSQLNNPASVSSTGVYYIKGTNPSTGCSDIKPVNAIINISPSVSSINGNNSMCESTIASYTNATPNGVWISSDNTKASISGSGFVTANVAGQVIISYRVSSNGCQSTATKTITINAVPVVSAIQGNAAVCAESSVTLSNSTGGGVWTSNSPSIATVIGNSGSGVVTGVTAGTATILYSVTNAGCTKQVTKDITVNPGGTTLIVTSPSNKSVTAPATTTFSVTATGGAGNYTYQWQELIAGNSTWTDINVAGFNPLYTNWTTPTLTVSNITYNNNNNQYRCVVKSSNNCKSYSVTSNAASAIVLNPPTISINETASTIPLWQREGEPFDGSITVDLSKAQNNTWYLEIDVFEPGATKATGFAIYQPTNANIFYFSTADIEISNLIKSKKIVNGSRLTYNVILGGPTNHFDIKNANKGTEIIEKKWENKNYVYYNDGVEQIKIPLLYYTNIGSLSVRFYRPNNSCNPCGTNIYPCDQKYNYLIVGNSIVAQYPTSQNPNKYLVIDPKDVSYNLKTVEPGDFTYEIDYFDNKQRKVYSENGTFEITKIGRVTYKNTTPYGVNGNRVMVFIGGLGNTTEAEIFNINNHKWVNNYDPSYLASENSYSIISYFNSLGYNTWYLAQGNTNGVKENAYDLGIALQKIQEITQSTDLNIITHSKGGLEIKALLGSDGYTMSRLNTALDGSHYNFAASALKNKIQKVLFLATPHKGSLLAALGGFLNSPAINDLKWDLGVNPNHIINILNNTVMPTEIRFANLSAYIASKIITTGGDQFVNLISSTAFNPNNNVPYLQLFQNNATHTSIHENKILSNYGNCISTTEPNNLEKIRLFFENKKATSCIWDNVTTLYSGRILGSVLTNSSLFIKNNEIDSNNNRIFTDETGKTNFQTLSPLEIGDTISIQTSGYESQDVLVDQNIINTRKFNATMFKSNSVSTLVQYPKFSLVNQTPVTSNKNILLNISAKNTKEFLINQHNSDSVFLPLKLTNSLASVLLDTGYNKLIVKFIGVDTISETKEVYFFPDSLYDIYSFPLSLHTTQKYIGAKMYVNNVFYQEVYDTMSIIRLPQQSSELKFIKYGYLDTVITVDSTMQCFLTMTPYSYSSIIDNINLDFLNGSKTQSWKNITVKNVSTSNDVQLSLKQYDDSFPNTGLQPQSRKFVFRNLSSGSGIKLRTAIALDQVDTPDTASVYILESRDGVYRKHRPNQANLSEYDPEVQKLAFDSLGFTTNKTDEITLMKKLPPIINTPPVSLYSGKDTIIPLRKFIADPDSLQDLNSVIAVILGATTNVSITIKDSLVYISSKRGFTGSLLVSLSATHDFITRSKLMAINIEEPPLQPDQLYIYPNPAHDNITVEFKLSADSDNTSLRINDNAGRLTKLLLSHLPLKQGYHYFTFPIPELPGGIYNISLNNKTVKQFIKY